MKFVPRFGVMRGTRIFDEDAYSFDLDENGMQVSYEKMYHALLKFLRA